MPPRSIAGLAALLGVLAPSAPQSHSLESMLEIDRGEGEQRLFIPRDEELVFQIEIDLGALGSPKVGTVTITSKVSPFHDQGLLAVGSNGEPQGEQALITAKAVGEYALYRADQAITTSILPQGWPHLVHRNVQSGTENRRSELLVGVRDGLSTSQHRTDGHCKKCDDPAHYMKPNWVWQDEYHCKKCKRAEHRVWRAWENKDAPEGALDMVSAMMAARSMVREQKSAASFALIDKEDLWTVDLSLGKRERRKVRAGTFEAVEVKLVTKVPAGEKGRDSDFEGLFGLHGTISIWMHTTTGVPIEVSGTVPAGPLDLDVSIQLTKHRGTPAEFRSLRSK